MKRIIFAAVMAATILACAKVNHKFTDGPMRVVGRPIPHTIEAGEPFNLTILFAGVMWDGPVVLQLFYDDNLQYQSTGELIDRTLRVEGLEVAKRLYMNKMGVWDPMDGYVIKEEVYDDPQMYSSEDLNTGRATLDIRFVVRQLVFNDGEWQEGKIILKLQQRVYLDCSACPAYRS